MTMRHLPMAKKTGARFVVPGVIALMLSAGLAGFTPGTARAHAPGTAVAELNQPLLQMPTSDSAALTELAAGSDLQLTGDADGQYVEVVAGEITGWVDVSLIHAGQIETAITTELIPITDAPSDDGQLLALVPAGDTVILTGAAVDDYLAGSYNGTGGWLPAASLD